MFFKITIANTFSKIKDSYLSIAIVKQLDLQTAKSINKIKDICYLLVGTLLCSMYKLNTHFTILINSL